MYPAPILGPAMAVVWGWLPALLWIVFGVIFMGATHDFGSLVLSFRHGGQSVGNLTERFIGPRNWDEPRYARALRRLLDAEQGIDG